jgi:hypothetical protein
VRPHAYRDSQEAKSNEPIGELLDPHHPRLRATKRVRKPLLLGEVRCE